MARIRRRVREGKNVASVDHDEANARGKRRYRSRKQEKSKLEPCSSSILLTVAASVHNVDVQACHRMMLDDSVVCVVN